ncbi:MAG: lysylphosphatidylglycerol synthase transmembrane domain-containing protein [Byssovorax sp.]
MSEPGGAAAPSKAPAIRKSLGRALVRLVGPLILAVLIWKTKDRGAILAALATASFGPIAAATLLNFANIHLKVIRWQVLLRARGIHYGTRRAWSAFLTSVYVGMLTPGRVGDVLRIQYLRHDLGVSYAEGLASIVMDRLCDLYVLSVFVAFGVIRYSPVIAGSLAFLTWGCLAGIVLGPLLLLIPGVAEVLMTRVYRKLSGDARAEGLARFLDAVRANVGRSLFLTLPLTAAAFLVNYVQGYVIGHAMGIDLGFVDAMCLLAVASMLGLLPVSVSGLGVRELIFALVFPFLGFTKSQGVSFGLLVFFVIYVVNIGAGFVFWQIAPPPSGSAAPPKDPAPG